MSDDLRVGRSLGRGEFRLDEERALEKLGEFQLPSPHHYVLELVKASRLLGSKSVAFSLGVRFVDVRFTGTPLPLPELRRLYSAAFAHRTTAMDEALRHLAIGLTAARSLGLREITIVVGGADPFGLRLTDDAIEEFAVTDPPRGTTIALQKTFSPRSVLRFADRLRGQMPEEVLLQDKCRYSPQEVLIDEVPVPLRDPFDTTTLVRQPLCWDDEVGEIALLNEDHVTTKILHHGVLLATERHPSPWERYGFAAILDSPRLSTNLSQSAFVEDEAWEDLHRRVGLAALGTLATHLEQLEEKQVRDRSAELRRLVFSVVGPLQADQRSAPEVKAFLTIARSLPIFHNARHLRQQPLGSIRHYPPEELCSLQQLRLDDGLIPYLDAPTIRFVTQNLLFFAPEEYGELSLHDFLSHFGRPELVTNIAAFFASRREAQAGTTEPGTMESQRPQLERAQRRSMADWDILVGRPQPSEQGVHYARHDGPVGEASLELSWLPLYVAIAAEDLQEADIEEPTEELRAAQEEAFALLASNLFFAADVNRLMEGVLRGEVQRAFADAFQWREFPEALEQRSLQALLSRARRQFGDVAEEYQRERARRRVEAHRLQAERAPRQSSEPEEWPEPYEAIRQLLLTHGGPDLSPDLTHLTLQRFARQDRTSVVSHFTGQPHEPAAVALAAMALHSRLVEGVEAKRSFLLSLLTPPE